MEILSLYTLLLRLKACLFAADRQLCPVERKESNETSLLRQFPALQVQMVACRKLGKARHPMLVGNQAGNDGLGLRGQTVNAKRLQLKEL